MNEDSALFPALKPPALAKVLARWDEPHRLWHGRKHLEFLLLKCSILPKTGYGYDLESDRQMLRYVALFHDVVYDAMRADNEEQSAKLAAQYLADYPRCAEVVAAILSTKTHESEDPLAQLFNSWDCSILREKKWEKLSEYENGIAFEYREVNREEYRRGRSRFLRKAAQDYKNPLLMQLADEVENGRA